jgi:uncharacterized MAPEG superfamily protein
MLESYGWALTASGLLALLYLIQLVIGDLAIDAAQHTPGTPVPGSHDSWLFRATRAPANSLENMPPFWALVFVAIGVSASPVWTNALALGFLACRIVHMCAYYLDVRVVRGFSWLTGLAIMFALATVCAVSLAHRAQWLNAPLPGFSV